MKNWKTTLCGVLAIIGGGLTQFFNDVPWLLRVGGFLATTAPAVGLLFAADSSRKKSSPPGAPSTTAPARGIVLLLAIPALLFANGCRSLDKSGVYAGDQVLYHAELTTTTAYDVIHTFVLWEKDNRAALAKWPDVKKSADTMRRGAPQWFKTAHALRDAYAAAPTPENRAALASILKVLRTAITEATFYMGQAAQPAPTPPITGIGVHTEP